MADSSGVFARGEGLVARAGGLHPPGDVLLNWPAPNYEDPETRGWESPIILIIMLVATIGVYVARMWARLVVAKNHGWDDIIMSLAMVPVVGLTVSAILAITKYGFQWHAWDQTKETLVTSREITMSIELNYVISTTLIKVAILLFYRRLTGSLKGAFIYSIWGMIFFCVVPSIIFVFLIIFTCTPVVGTFRLFDITWMIKHGGELTCRDEGAIIVSCAIVGSIQDLLICIMPAMLVWDLKMSTRQKTAVCAIFGVGMISCVCGILRSYYAAYVYYRTYDITWYAYHGWVWTALEADFGVMCASAPALKVFFKRYFNLSNITSAGSKSGTNQRSIPLSSRSRGFGVASALSKQSRGDQSGVFDDAPFQGIKVSQGLDIQVEERDDCSQKSFGSTRNLTAKKTSDEIGEKDWKTGCRTVCAAVPHDSRNASKDSLDDIDLERGQPSR